MPYFPLSADQLYRLSLRSREIPIGATGSTDSREKSRIDDQQQPLRPDRHREGEPAGVSVGEGGGASAASATGAVAGPLSAAGSIRCRMQPAPPPATTPWPGQVASSGIPFRIGRRDRSRAPIRGLHLSHPARHHPAIRSFAGNAPTGYHRSSTCLGGQPCHCASASSDADES